MGRKQRGTRFALESVARRVQIFSQSDGWVYGNGRHRALLAWVDEASNAEEQIALVPSLDGNRWGTIPDCLTPYPEIRAVDAADIVIPFGNMGEGYVHVVEKHAAKIASLHGGMSVNEYIQDVLRHYQEIYRQSDGSLVLLRRNGVRKCAIVARAIINGALVYKLVTAYPLPRKPDYEKRRAVRLTYK